MKAPLPYITISVIFVLGFVAMGAYIHKTELKTTAEINGLKNQLAILNDTFASTTNALALSTDENIKTAISNIPKASSTPVAKSQDQQLTETVAKLTPSVVSIVISKDVPQLEVEYVNPFGDNPAYKNLNFQVPVYKQKGTVLKKVGAGSGFIVSKDGFILTNRHVAADATAHYTVLLSDGKQKEATVIYRDPNNDLAVLKISGTYTPVKLGDSAKVKLGQSVVAIGNALGEYNNSVSVGIVSGLNRTITASDNNGKNAETLSGVIQTDAAINEGNSGGPLLDLAGNVIGINVATVIGSSNISFSIPINTVKSLLGTMVE